VIEVRFEHRLDRDRLSELLGFVLLPSKRFGYDITFGGSY